MVLKEDSLSSGSPRPPLAQLYPDPTIFHLDDIILQFNTMFTTHDKYLAYVCKYLPDWLKDPDFKLFDGAYCQHCLLLTQIENLQSMTQTLSNMADNLAKVEWTQVTNIKQLIPKLTKKNFEARLQHTFPGIAPLKPEPSIP